MRGNMTTAMRKCMVLNRGHTHTHTRWILQKGTRIQSKSRFLQKISEKTSNIIRNERILSKRSVKLQKNQTDWGGSSTSSAPLCLSENGTHQQELLGNHRRPKMLKFMLWLLCWKRLALPLLSCSSSFCLPSANRWLTQSGC